MERISREIKKACDVINPTTNNPGSSLELSIKNGATTTITKFSLNGDNIEIYENGSLTSTGPLNSPKIKIAGITGLTFTQLTTIATAPKAIKIYLEIQSMDNALIKAKFYNTIFLRNNKCS